MCNGRLKCQFSFSAISYQVPHPTQWKNNRTHDGDATSMEITWINLHFPDEMNSETGLMVILHGWGGTYHQYDAYCKEWRNRYNVITLQVNYRNSGDGSPIYDFGKYQAIDVLRAIQYVRGKITKSTTNASSVGVVLEEVKLSCKRLRWRQILSRW